MEEVEYVVPPQGGASSSLPSKGPSNKPNAPKKPNRVLLWAKSHKLQSVAGLIMVAIIVLVGTVMVTGQKLSLFGLQLNPLYQQANCPPPIDPVLLDKDGQPIIDESQVPNCGGGGGGGLDPARVTINGTFADGKVGVPYTQVFTLSGGTGICTWSVDSSTPKLEGANFVFVEGGPATTATFRATPTVAGTYQVTIKVVCGDGRPQTTQVLPWKVTAATGGNEDITAVFSDGTAGQQYTTSVSVKNKNCTLALVKVDPTISGASLVRVENVTQPDGVSYMFNATPQTGGTYIVKISATCNPAVGDGPTTYVEKDFTWKVNMNPQFPPSETITANFADGKVAQAYTTTVTSPDNTRGGIYDCTLALVKVNPDIKGASLGRIKTTDPAKPITYNFSATPQTAGTYKVTISLTCSPAGDSKIKSTYVEKEFTWKVTAATTGGGGSGGGSGSGGSSSAICDMSKLKPIYRWWNNIDKDHFFTTNQGEKPNGYKYEGIAGYVFKEQVAGSVPIYRSYKLSITAHYYATTNDAAQYGYNPEGILGYGFTESKTGITPWFRLHAGWNYNDYIETISAGEKAAILAGAAGFTYADEGIAAYICPPDQPAS